MSEENDDGSLIRFRKVSMQKKASITNARLFAALLTFSGTGLPYGALRSLRTVFVG